MKRARFLGPVVLSVFLASQLGAFAHVLLTSHRLCDQHGELVHVNTTVLAVNGSTRADEETDRLDERLPTKTDSPSHAHGCLFAPSLRGMGISTGGSTLPCPGAALARQPHDPNAGAIRSIATLQLAPKHSPPFA